MIGSVKIISALKRKKELLTYATMWINLKNKGLHSYTVPAETESRQVGLVPWRGCEKHEQGQSVGLCEWLVGMLHSQIHAFIVY